MTHRSPIAQQLITSISKGNLKDMHDVLRLDHTVDDATDALAFAACLGKIECVEILLPHSNPLKDNSGALRMASAKGFRDCVRALLPVSNANALNGEALAVACQNNHVQCVKELLAHTNSQWYSNALFLAVIHQNRRCVKIMLEFPCHAPEILNELKIMYPHDATKWHVLEEELQNKNIYLALPHSEQQQRARKM